MCAAEKETYNIITSHLVRLTPGAHDIGVIISKHGDDVDTLCAQLGKLLNVFGDVTGGADGSEGAREREADDLLVGPFFRGVVVDGDAAGRDVAFFFGPGDVADIVSDRYIDIAELFKYLREHDVRGEVFTSVERHGVRFTV